MIFNRKLELFRHIPAVLTLLVMCSIPFALAVDEAKQTYIPKVADKSDEGVKAIASIVKPAGFEIHLWAAEPDVANPVAFSIDEKGRIYVAETFRQGDAGGVVDNRGHMYWLDDDLAAQTVEDRRAFMLKHHKEKLEQWTKHHDRIRLLEDTKGNGYADKATIFSTGYNDLVDGTGAGVLAWRGNIYYTCIPKLYVLRDDNNDGVADETKTLSEGYGVRIAFRGHDMHGLVMGPDGRIYFSIGDRGYHITTKEGKLLHDPGSGAVFRCEPDGSHLEVVHTGLRNPQELVFDDYGNLFTGDNNSDSGDRARWVYIVEGGHTGWNMSFQYLSDRGPWNREGWWHEWDAAKSPTEFAAHIVPPIKHIGNGPSGVTYYPGTGFDDSYRGTFFMCDFKGGPNVSGVWSFKLKSQGAGFALDDLKHFIWGTLVTDADFGPDGAFYFSDWVNGWEGLGKGRIYRMTQGEGIKNDVVAQTKKLLAEGFTKRSEEELLSLLKHPNRMVRQESQFALAERNSYDFLLEAVKQKENQLARLHGIWGLAQAARRSKDNDQLPDMIAGFAGDEDAEVRAQVARVLSDLPGLARGKAALSKLINDSSDRVRALALPSYGKSMAKGDTKDHADAVAAILPVLAANADKDPFLRTAAVVGLSYLNDAQALIAKMGDENHSARLGILLALRRLGDPHVAAFLQDSNPQLVLEAARAIHDQPIDKALPQLALMISTTAAIKDEALLRRAISANYLMGGVAQAQTLASYAKREDAPASMRSEALDALMDWAGTSKRDRVLGAHRPVMARAADEAKDVAGKAAMEILANSAQANVRQAAAKVIEHYRVAAAAPLLLSITKDDKQSGWLRMATLKALGAMNDPALSEAVTATLGASDANLRKESRQWLSKLKPAEAIDVLEKVLDTGEVSEKQGAIVTLSDMKQAGADAVLEKQFDKLLAGKLQPELSLELLDAAKARATPRIKLKIAAYETSQPKDDPLRSVRQLLVGGDAADGKKIFWEKAAASCNRCHMVGKDGVGEAGPNLLEIAKQGREYILESMLYPNRKIAQGFDTFDIETSEGDRIIGILKEDKPDELIIVTAENKRVTVKKSNIADKRKALSAMPDNIVKLLTERELRDLVEYLATIK